MHGDVKPTNVVLRGGDVMRPVLVDFGLSFNNAEEDDGTRVGEEVGSRFLRLPEHATGGRGDASDVTQLAEILLYCVSGCEPRVLLDEGNKMPHQRLPARGTLENALTPRAYLRVLSVFDGALSTTLSRRYVETPELISDLEAAMCSDGDDLEDLLAQVDELARSRGLIAQVGDRQSLQRFMDSIRQALDDFSFPRGFRRSQTRYKECLDDDEPWMEIRYSVHVLDSVPWGGVVRIGEPSDS
ncbi:hypothetical protein [Mycobacterium sp. AZCC_0083]|uniref:hypothetical protein n=1 Tax=Mycobacterium sp. AZCC_0083 TaxID=2735882 RepID=UPI0016095989|nr:hypothetical protein [Mycobacterium sp. AZCC_0083]MBB5167643.1 serine/threonine protein kinase [Mycobacterium sp. AZCC_0083]